MTDTRQGVMAEEPIGIVICSGSRTPPTPRVWAYVWAQVPEVTPQGSDAKAA